MLSGPMPPSNVRGFRLSRPQPSNVRGFRLSRTQPINVRGPRRPFCRPLCLFSFLCGKKEGGREEDDAHGRRAASTERSRGTPARDRPFAAGRPLPHGSPARQRKRQASSPFWLSHPAPHDNLVACMILEFIIIIGVCLCA